MSLWGVRFDFRSNVMRSLIFLLLFVCLQLEIDGRIFRILDFTRCSFFIHAKGITLIFDSDAT